MDISESFPGRPGGNGKGKKELPQEERTLKQERWSSLFYKLRDENLTDEQREITKRELEELRKEIT